MLRRSAALMLVLLASGRGRNACGARAGAEALQAEAIAAVNDGDVPDELQEELLGSVNALLAAIGCDPAVALDSAVTDARRLAALLRESSG